MSTHPLVEIDPALVAVERIPQRQMTELQPSEGATRMSDMRSTTWEEGEGKSFREPDMAAVLDGVCQEEHLRVTLEAILGVDVDLELAEAASEGDLLRFRDLLAAKEDHPVLVERGVDLAEGRLVHRHIGKPILVVPRTAMHVEQSRERSGTLRLMNVPPDNLPPPAPATPAVPAQVNAAVAKGGRG